MTRNVSGQRAPGKVHLSPGGSLVPAGVPKRVAQALGCQCHPSQLSRLAASELSYFWFGMRSSSAGCPGNARCSPPDGDNICQDLLKILPNTAVAASPMSHPSPGLKLGRCCPCWPMDQVAPGVPPASPAPADLAGPPAPVPPQLGQPKMLGTEPRDSQQHSPTQRDGARGAPWGGTSRHGRAAEEGNDSLEFK